MREHSLLKAGLAACLFFSAPAFGFEGPLRDPKQLIMPIDQPAMRVTTARVLKADYDLLRRDFASLAKLSDAEIKSRLERAAGAISASQTRPNNVNTKIPTNGEEIKAYRPRGYGRGLVFPFEDGLLDGKGAGALSPGTKDHANGLASTIEAFREFMMEKTVSRVLKHAGYKPGTVEAYAVIDYGFDIVNVDGTRDPAGLVLRQAAVRDNAQGMMNPKAAMEMERTLRRYGIMSDNTAFDYEYHGLDRANVQATKAGNIFDFGSYQILPEKFELKGSPVQPDPAIRVPANMWSLKEAPPGIDAANAQEREIMKKLIGDWRDGKIPQAAVDDFVQTRLAPVSARFSPSCSLIPALEKLAK